MLKVELHQHTQFSPDSSISYQDLFQAYQSQKFDVVAITDHNTIDGALDFKARNQFPVIIGEEIITQEDKDLIGLFLTEPIPPHLEMETVFTRIKDQGGLILVPHPFDRLGNGIGRKRLIEHIKEIDLIEAYNGAGEFLNRNSQSSSLADQFNKIKVACSDAHFADEIGQVVTLVPVDDVKILLHPQGLLSSLQDCQYITNYYSVFNRFLIRFKNMRQIYRLRKNT